MSLLSIEAATAEWVKFLEENDAEHLVPSENSGDTKEEKEEYKISKTGFDRMVKAIANGIVVIDNGIISQTLRYPIKTTDGSKTIADKLVFSERWTGKDREEIMSGMKADETKTVLAAQRKLCAKLTGIDAMVLQRLDITDLKITDQIVSVFFA